MTDRFPVRNGKKEKKKETFLACSMGSLICSDGHVAGKIVAGQANFVKPLTMAVSVGMAAFLFKGFKG